ncbi:hypothetical protein EDB81DRAFT_940069 [Dactylonectria macrodidyma]|uniref:Uncharacterized protein n=1 Tax=Dactylonectria macrodidyma TaxID=307937 RepID=A0A9P9FTM1_9HYPO|nr:hypothetical protein EDB81DRAFT_940069 [Dactylonectria macrodidyma]
MKTGRDEKPHDANGPNYGEPEGVSKFDEFLQNIDGLVEQAVSVWQRARDEKPHDANGLKDGEPEGDAKFDEFLQQINGMVEQAVGVWRRAQEGKIRLSTASLASNHLIRKMSSKIIDAESSEPSWFRPWSIAIHQASDSPFSTELLKCYASPREAYHRLLKLPQELDLGRSKCFFIPQELFRNYMTLGVAIMASYVARVELLDFDVARIREKANEDLKGSKLLLMKQAIFEPFPQAFLEARNQIQPPSYWRQAEDAHNNNIFALGRISEIVDITAAEFHRSILGFDLIPLFMHQCWYLKTWGPPGQVPTPLAEFLEDAHVARFLILASQPKTRKGWKRAKKRWIKAFYRSMRQGLDGLEQTDELATVPDELVSEVLHNQRYQLGEGVMSLEPSVEQHVEDEFSFPDTERIQTCIIRALHVVMGPPVDRETSWHYLWEMDPNSHGKMLMEAFVKHWDQSTQALDTFELLQFFPIPDEDEPNPKL